VHPDDEFIRVQPGITPGLISFGAPCADFAASVSQRNCRLSAGALTT